MSELLGLQFGFKLNLAPNYGAYLVSILFSNMLLGITCLQVWIYFRKYKDGFLIQGMVITLLILELLHGAFSMHAIYHYVINNFANPFALLLEVWSMNVTIIIKVLIVVLVQSSYGIRIYYVSNRKSLVPIVMIVLAIAALGIGCALTAELFRRPLVTSLIGKPEHIGAVLLSIGAFANFLVVGTMGYYLNNSRTGIRQTEKIIDRMIFHLVNNGMLTGVIEIATIVLVFTNPDDFYFMALSQVIGTLYANSWMATLNSRKRHEKVTKLVASTTISFNTSHGTTSVTATPEKFLIPRSSTQC